jgi:hypothetical protein
LAQHPQFLQDLAKEVHYFDGGPNPDDDTFERGEQWYRAHFPLKGALSKGRITFEASPSYMVNPLVPRRMFELVPRVKVVALLRNPTERAISHYFHSRRHGNESLSLAEALREEEKRLEPVLLSHAYKSRAFRQHSYKYRGLYCTQLLRYREYFPPQQMCILCSEEFFREPHIVLQRMFDFVGVDRDFQVENLIPRNVSPAKQEVGPEIYQYLNEYFAPHNQALYKLVGMDYGW